MASRPQLLPSRGSRLGHRLLFGTLGCANIAQGFVVIGFGPFNGGITNVLLFAFVLFDYTVVGAGS